MQLEESLRGVRDPLSAGGWDRNGCWALWMHKGYGRRASSEEQSTFFCLALHREQEQLLAKPGNCSLDVTEVMKIICEDWSLAKFLLNPKQRTHGVLFFLCRHWTRAAEMWSCITDFFTYETTKSVVVKSWTIGIINRIVQLLIITYFIGWVFQAVPDILH